MLSRRLLNKCAFQRFIYVVSHVKQFSSYEIDPNVVIPPEVRLSAPKAKLPKREPFVKNFFLGKFDIEFAAYPEPQTPDRHRDFFEWLKPVEDYIYNKVDSADIERNAQIPQNVIDDLNVLGVFRAIIPETYKGFGLNSSELAKLIEVISHIPCLGAYFSKQLTTINFILDMASEKQKLTFLPRIASGELTPTFCISEDIQACKGSAILSVAQRSDCAKFYSLTGHKTFVPNANISNLFIVFAESREPGQSFGSDDTISAFLVERDFGGITIKDPIVFTGLRGYPLCDITFDKTTIPADHMIGAIGTAGHMFTSIYGKGKEYIGSQAIGLIRRFVQLLAKNLKQNTHFNAMVFKNDAAREVMGKISCMLYAMESIVFLTTGMMDCYDDQNCDVEKCIIEAFCTETCVQSILMGMQFLGPSAHTQSTEINQLIRDAMCLTTIDGPSASTKSLIASMGLQHTGRFIAEEINIRRNPTQFPLQTLKTLFSTVKKRKDLLVDDNLHPSLQETALLFEETVHVFENAVNFTTAISGAEILDKHITLRRISEVAVDLYVMSAIMARASRSYCLGMRNGEQELNLAQYLGYTTHQNAKRLLDELDKGDWWMSDYVMQNVADRVFEQDGYIPAHPMARNF